MAIFSKKDEQPEQEVGRVAKEAISCIISKEMQISGEINFKGKARIDGTVEGNIQGEYLILSESGRINGDLVLDALINHGVIEGNIEAKMVTAHSTATIRGRLTSGSLTVEPGAVLEGEIRASSKQNPGGTVVGTAGTVSTAGKTKQQAPKKEPAK